VILGGKYTAVGFVTAVNGLDYSSGALGEIVAI